MVLLTVSVTIEVGYEIILQRDLSENMTGDKESLILYYRDHGLYLLFLKQLFENYS